MKICAFDIETIPDRNLPQECIPVFDPESVKYGNLKDPIKRAAKAEEERLKFEEGKIKTMSVDPDMLEICTFVAFLYDTKTDQVTDKCSVQITDQDENDYNAVWDGWQFIKKCYYQQAPIVSYNGINFDFPAMRSRAMVLDVPIKYSMYAKFMKQWEGNKDHFDLMRVLLNFNMRAYKKLDFYLKRLQVGAKTEGMDGSKVYGAFQEGRFDEIQKYCEDDVIETARLFARVEPWITG
jgi:predicted PolB exonuclease-like 3'-5' exonuclease